MLSGPANRTVERQVGQQAVNFVMPSDLEWFKYLSYNQDYEPEVVRSIARFVRQGDTVIDCGASIGYFTLMLSRLVGDDGNVIAFEPNRPAYAKLINNLRINATNNVWAAPIALFDQNCLLDFWPVEGDGLEGNSSLLHQENAIAVPVEVQARTLDSIVSAECGPVKFLKIDCEGAEWFVLKGAHDLLTRGVDCVIVEVNFDILSYIEKQTGVSERDIRDYMAALGYDCFLPFETGGVPLHIPRTASIKPADNSGKWHFNFMFAKQEAVSRAWLS